MIKVIISNLLLLSVLSTAAQFNSDSLPQKENSRKETQKQKNQNKIVVIPPDLSDPPFINYLPSTLFITHYDSTSVSATIRRNFTDQFISVWDEPGRIYPSSKIFGITQQGKYYRSCKIDPRNSIFGELIVKGKINLYFARKLPQEAGLIEMISTDPKNTGYRNFMIMEYEDKARFESDFYFFITLENDSLRSIPINDYAEVAELYLKEVPEAYNLMLGFAKKRKSATRIVAPLMASALIVAVLAAPTLEVGLLVSAPVIGSGIAYSIYRKKKGLSKPMPEDMAKIFSLFNSEINK